MRKILTIVSGLACFSAMILCSAEKEDGSCDIVWSVTFFAIALFFGWLFYKLSDNGKKHNQRA
ncbi:MAG: hypothetical protein J5639_00080 [Bacteroidales bacterium]|nr:hypothetical protein [Bacteroidales bacterium]